MAKIRILWFLFGLALASLFAGCLPAATPSPVPPTLTVTASPFKSQTPAATATASLTPSKTPIPSNTPLPSSTPGIQASLPPSLEGTRLPEASAPLTQANLGQAVELARWGQGISREIRFSADGRSLGLLSSIGQTLFDGQSFATLPFDEAQWASLFAPAIPGLEQRQTEKGIEIWRDGAQVGLIKASSAFFSPDRNLLAIPRSGSSLELWDATRAGRLGTFNAPESDENWVCGGIAAAGISPDRQWLAAGCADPAGIVIWHIPDGELKAKIGLPLDSYFALGLAFSPDASQVAGVVLGGDVCIWETTNGQLLRCLSGSRVNYYVGDVQLVFAPDGQTLVGGFPNGEVLAWQVNSGQLLKRLRPTAPSGAALAFSADGRLLAAAAFRDVRVWDTASGQPLSATRQPGAFKRAMLAAQPAALSGPSGEVEFVAFSPDGSTLIFGLDSSRLFWGRPGDERSYQPADLQTGEILAFTAGGDFVLAANLSSLQREQLTPVTHLHGPNLGVYAFSPDGQLFASSWPSSPTEYRLEVRRVSGNGLLWRQETSPPAQLAISPDNASLGMAISGSVEVWRIAEKTRQYRLRPHKQIDLACLAFSPDGQLLATAGSEGIIYLWNAADGLFLRTLEGHRGSIRDLAFSPDGSLLASVSADGSLRLWGVP